MTIFLRDALVLFAGVLVLCVTVGLGFAHARPVPDPPPLVGTWSVPSLVEVVTEGVWRNV